MAEAFYNDFPDIGSLSFPTTISYNGKMIYITDYNSSQDSIQSLNAERLSARESGFAAYLLGNTYGAFLSPDINDKRDKIAVIAHEIGHILLEHEMKDRIIGHSSDKTIRDKQEIEAIMFMNRYLSLYYDKVMMLKKAKRELEKASKVAKENLIKTAPALIMIGVTIALLVFAQFAYIQTYSYVETRNLVQAKNLKADSLIESPLLTISNILIEIVKPSELSMKSIPDKLIEATN